MYLGNLEYFPKLVLKYVTMYQSNFAYKLKYNYNKFSCINQSIYSLECLFT